MSMPGFGFGQIQTTSQVQTQRLSQKQIQSLNLLSLGSQDLRAEILKAVEENPALEIVSGEKISTQKIAKKNIDDTRLGKSSQSGEEKAERFQQMLEAEPDTRETLREHLMFQLDMLRITETEYTLGKKLIDNLDERGFYMLAPISLCDETAGETEILLKKMIDVIQSFDPIGICCASVEESLLLQARATGKITPLVTFLLDSHLKMLDPPIPSRVQKKLLAYKADVSKLSFANLPDGNTHDNFFAMSEDDFSLEKISDAISLIRNLNPYPAQQFGSDSTHYVQPDVYITKESGHYEKDNIEEGIVVCDENNFYKVRLANGNIPTVRVARDFVDVATANNVKKTKQLEVTQAIEKANSFIVSLSYRTTAIMRICCELVKVQMNFFEKGEGNLVPLTRREIATRLEVHESTVSRMADSKYIQCAWGMFPIKYFFTSGVANASDESTETSREAVIVAIKNILDAHAHDAKPLSDQKLADALLEQGIKIARRTVAKYRSSISIGSSYQRVN